MRPRSGMAEWLGRGPASPSSAAVARCRPGASRSWRCRPEHCAGLRTARSSQLPSDGAHVATLVLAVLEALTLSSTYRDLRDSADLH